MSHPKRIFITGSTGFVGASLVRHFAAQSWDVRALGRGAAPKALLDLAHYVQADLRNPIPAQSAKVVIHAAALASDSASWADLEQANVKGTQHVFEATKDCPCFIYISSSSVYPLAKPEHEESETIDIQQLSPYGRSKRLAEAWLLEQDWSGRKLFILRPRAIYGVGDRVLLPRLMRLVRLGRIVSPGDMRVQSSLTHIKNLSAAIDLCIDADRTGAHIFNVADQEVYEMRAIVQGLLSEIHGRELPFWALPLGALQSAADFLERIGWSRQFTPYALAAVSKASVLNLQKIEVELGYSAPATLWDSIPGIAAWVQKTGLERVKNAESELPFSI